MKNQFETLITAIDGTNNITEAANMTNSTNAIVKA